MNLKKLILSIVVLLLIIGGFLTYNTYTKIYSENTTKDGFIYIQTNSSFKDVENQLRPFLKRVNWFSWVAKKKNYPNTIKAGKYKIAKNISNNDLVNLLRSGNQTPVIVTFNNQDSLEKLAGRISDQIEPDSLSLFNVMSDSLFLKQHDFSTKDALAMYIPNSYEFYWNTSAKNFRAKMLQEYHKFWSASRVAKAAELGLSKKEVITLASIVQKETAQISERPIVAGLYLNRLKKGWPLQADPTVIYALKEINGDDFIVKRVLKKDLEINSPYNTYKIKGLPPTLIAMPDISSIDAVLNPTKHNYFYMCASVDKMGFHEFSSSLRTHNMNAAKYQRWISSQGINR